LAGLFHRNPALLSKGLDWYAELGLAVLHGAPLAWVAYLVADLLLHKEGTDVPEKEPVPTPQAIDVVGLVREAQASLERSMREALAGIPALVRQEVKEAAYHSAADGGGGGNNNQSSIVGEVLKELPENTGRPKPAPKQDQEQEPVVITTNSTPKKSGEQIAKDLLGEIFGMDEEAAQRQVDVATAIWKEVPERDKKIVQLKTEGLSNRQIAEEVGMSESGVRGVLARSK
jgi:DNA-binding NarL/FixJ family response regulator